MKPLNGSEWNSAQQREHTRNTRTHLTCPFSKTLVQPSQWSTLISHFKLKYDPLLPWIASFHLYLVSNYLPSPHCCRSGRSCLRSGQLQDGRNPNRIQQHSSASSSSRFTYTCIHMAFCFSQTHPCKATSACAASPLLNITFEISSGGCISVGRTSLSSRCKSSTDMCKSAWPSRPSDPSTLDIWAICTGAASTCWGVLSWGSSGLPGDGHAELLLYARPTPAREHVDRERWLGGMWALDGPLAKLAAGSIPGKRVLAMIGGWVSTNSVSPSLLIISWRCRSCSSSTSNRRLRNWDVRE